MNDEYVEPDNRGSSWKDVLVADRWRIAMVLVAVVGVAMYYNYEPEIPRWFRLFGLAALVAGILGYPVAARIVQWLYTPDYRYLIDVDARDNEFAIWQLPPAEWRELEVKDGELFEVRALAPAWECRDYDPEENSAVGTWRGSRSDLELIEERESIDEVRGELESLAQEGLSIRVKQSGIVRTAVRNITMSMVEGFESGTIYRGEEIAEALDGALDKWSDDDDKGDDVTEDKNEVENINGDGRAETNGVVSDD